MAFFSSLAAAIDSYTGLSPAAFFTIVALMVGAYRLVSAFFVYPDEESAAKRSLAPQMPPPPEAFSPPPQPVQLGDITLEDLKAYDGSDPNKPLLVAIKGQVYDVSIGRRRDFWKRVVRALGGPSAREGPRLPECKIYPQRHFATWSILVGSATSYSGRPGSSKRPKPPI
ncbi:membrane steroid-binding protein 2-like isoform X2 [Zingiber officinale]|uniref:membrane steroid-binding protein 2-like isoform X2 n=1 Tax=Zingiber officinale TaxID=94328 RepID=UPI001C4BED94|nr:membrane steroid-binding protein 2-like isoform X2 [Zingiber officinale]